MAKPINAVEITVSTPESPKDPGDYNPDADGGTTLWWMIEKLNYEVWKTRTDHPDRDPWRTIETFWKKVHLVPPRTVFPKG